MLLQVLLSSLLFSANYVIAAASYPTCAMFTSELIERDGFDIALYELSYSEPVGKISDEFLSYVEKTQEGPALLIPSSDIGFNVSIPSGEVYRGNFQGKENVLLSHMAVVYFADLVVPETGEYTFSFDGVSDGAALFILDDLDSMCCENAANTDSQGFDAFSKFYYIPDDPNYQTKSMTFNLVAGMPYVLYISYVNHDGDAIFEPTMTTPSGEIITNFKGYLYNGISEICKTGNSTSSVVSQWSETYTTTSTTIVTNVGTVSGYDLPYTEVETIYYIMTPAPASESSSVVSSSSDNTISSSLTSSSSLSESTLSSSSVNLSSIEQTSAVSSQQSSTISSSVSLSSESLSTVPSSGISMVTLSDSKTELISSTVSEAVTSSVVSSSEEASVSSFTQSSKILSSVHTVLSSLDGDSSTKQLTKSTASSVLNTFTSVPASSQANVFSNSSATNESIKSSTGYPLTKSIQSNSSAENSGDAGHFGNEDYLTTSTYTDVYGMTRTTTVRCSTQSNDINPTSESHLSDITVVTVTSCSNKKCETVVSTMARPTDLVKTTVTGKLDQQGTTTSSGYSGASSVASVAVQLQSSRGSSSATHTVQQAPNAAGKYTVGLLFSVIPIAFPLFFM